MECIIAIAVIAAAAGDVCARRCKLKPTAKSVAAFICRKCSEHHCQCELPN